MYGEIILVHLDFQVILVIMYLYIVVDVYMFSSSIWYK